MKTEVIEYNRECFLLTRHFLRVATRVYAIGLLAVLALAVAIFPAAGRAGTPEWLLFIGRFHPLVLHFPIGLLMLLPVLHLLVRVCPGGTLRPAVAVVLMLSAGSAVCAALFGILLSQEGGFSGATFSLHRLLALGLSVLVIFLMLCESESENPCERKAQFARRSRYAYRALFPLVFICLGASAHLGATLTHGETYLTEHLPKPVKQMMGIAPKKAALRGNAYGDVVAPILEARCTSCHGADKSKGGLRLDNAAAILAGGDSQRDENKHTVLPGRAAESLLIQALCRPVDEDEHMPPKGKPQLTAAEVETLRQWIDSGADGLTHQG